MRCFFDTNVVVYAFDQTAPAKSAVAQRLLAECIARSDAFLSTQVLQEFFTTVTRKLSTPLPHREAEQAVRELAKLPIVNADATLILDAIALSERYLVSLWDALIIQAALRAGAEILYTEDLQDGQVIDSLTIKNPFAGIQG
jgi:predicted nucleic acid-binding protein